MSAWWPGITSQVTNMIQRYKECARQADSHRKPLITSLLPDYPWLMIGSDLFEHKGEVYLSLVDCFSWYPEVVRLSSTTSGAVTAAMKSIFSRYGIPEVIRSDNGPQYSSHQFAQFAKFYGFQHVTRSPRFSQSNDLAEQTIKIIKRLSCKIRLAFIWLSRIN